MKKLLFCSLLFSFLLFGEVSPYYEMGMQRLIERASCAATEKEKLHILERLNRWLLLVDKVEFNPQEIQRIMESAEPWLAQMSQWSYEFQQLVRPHKKQQCIEVEVNGRKAIAYLNAYSFRSQAPFSEETIQQFLAREKENYEKYKIYEGFPLSSLESLPSGNYNFVVSLEEVAHISIHQEYDSMLENGFKILISPNHAVLSGGLPVLTAGEMRVIGKGAGRIYIISHSSGHYQPDFSSLVEMEMRLIALGVPKACIIKAAIPLEKLGWKLMHYYENQLFRP